MRFILQSFSMGLVDLCLQNFLTAFFEVQMGILAAEVVNISLNFTQVESIQEDF